MGVLACVGMQKVREKWEGWDKKNITGIGMGGVGVDRASLCHIAKSCCDRSVLQLLALALPPRKDLDNFLTSF